VFDTGAAPEEGPAPRWHFFLSYTAADREWAEWVAWQLEDAGYRVLFQAWDFVAGSHWTTRMEEGITGAEHTLAILSRAYLNSVYGRAEWQAAHRADPRGLRRKLIPIRVEGCDRPGLLGEVVSLDLFGLTAEAAGRRLLDAVGHARAGRAKPETEPAFPAPTPPSGAEPAFPGPRGNAAPGRLGRLRSRRARIAAAAVLLTAVAATGVALAVDSASGDGNRGVAPGATVTGAPTGTAGVTPTEPASGSALPSSSPASPGRSPSQPPPRQPEPESLPRTAIPPVLQGRWDGDDPDYVFSANGDVVVGTLEGTAVVDGESITVYLKGGRSYTHRWNVSACADPAGYGYPYRTLQLDGYSYVQDCRAGA
jgi:hypothetical protein